MQTRGERLEGMRKGLRNECRRLLGRASWRDMSVLLKERRWGPVQGGDRPRRGHRLDDPAFTLRRRRYGVRQGLHQRLGAGDLLFAPAVVGERLRPGSAERVPEPLGFCAEEKAVADAGGPGRAPESAPAPGAVEQVLPGVRAAARWLARLHASTPAGLPSEPPCNRAKVFDLADRLGKAAANHPEDLGLLLDRLQRLRTLAPAGARRSSRPRPVHAGQRVHRRAGRRRNRRRRISLSDPAKGRRNVPVPRRRPARERGRPSGGGRAARPRVLGRVPGAGGAADRKPPVLHGPVLAERLREVRQGPCGRRPVRRQAEAIHLDRFERCFPGEAPPRTDDAPRIGSRPSPSTAAPASNHPVPDPAPAAAGRGSPGMQEGHTGPGRRHGARDDPLRVRRRHGRLRQALHRRPRSPQLSGAKAFWECGFGRDSRFRVPKPMAFLPRRTCS